MKHCITNFCTKHNKKWQIIISMILALGAWLYLTNTMPEQMQPPVALDISTTNEFTRGGVATTNFKSLTSPMANDRKLVKNVNMTMLTDDVTVSLTQIKTFLQNNGAIIQNENFSSLNNTPNVYLSFRVPQVNVAKVLNYLQNFAELLNMNVSSNDVTNNYEDTQARLDNMLAQRKVITKFYERAKNVSESVKIYTQLAQLNRQIDQLQAQMKRLNQQTTTSLFNLSLQEKVQAGTTGQQHWSWSKGWIKAYNNLVIKLGVVYNNLVQTLVYIVLWGPILVVIWFGVTVIINKHK